MNPISDFKNLSGYNMANTNTLKQLFTSLDTVILCFFG